MRALARIVAAYVRGEVRVLRADDVYAALRDFLADIIAVAIDGLRLDLRVSGDPLPEAPTVVLARHGGVGDSVLLVHLLLSGGRRPRIVMKKAVALDPAVRRFTSRTPNALIDPSDEDDACAKIERLAAGMGRGDALLLFPEGGNVTEGRRREAVRRLLRAGELRRAERASRLEHLGAPRPGGTLVALGAAPQADVVFAAHAGLPMKALPRDTRVDVRLWHVPAAERPEGEQAVVDWLDGWWARLDEWVDSQR